VAQTVQRLGHYAAMAKDGWRIRHGRTDDVQSRARKHLAERMGRLRGLPQKLGQMISFSSGDAESTQDYAALQENAEPLPLSTVRPILESEWGRPVDQVVQEIAAGANAASLGQVHRATLNDGREVAVKVQYPGIREAIQLDLKMLGWLSLPVGNLRRGFDLAGYADVILNDIDKELNYAQEAEFQRAFSSWAQEDSFLAVPNVVDELSTSKVLVTEWQEGDHWNEVQTAWTEQEKNELGGALVRFFHEGLFQRALLHADWHPGNLRFRRSDTGVELLLYDFGCVYRPSDEERLTLLRLIRATHQEDEPPYPLFAKLGFQEDYLEPLASKLPALCKVLFEPYAVEYPYNLDDWRLGERFSDILGDDRWNFRIAGPPSLIFLLRAFHGLLFYTSGLEARVPWNRVVRPLFKRFAEDMRGLQLPAINDATNDFGSLAKHLKIRVVDDGRTKVQLTHRASAIDNLDDLLDEPLKKRIDDQGINLSEVVASVRRGGYRPGNVFDLDDDKKQILVWLE